VTVVRFQRVSALAGAARLTAAASARATAMTARKMILDSFMCGGAPFGGRPSRVACVVGGCVAGQKPVSRRPNAIPKMRPNRRARVQAEGVMFQAATCSLDQ